MTSRRSVLTTLAAGAAAALAGCSDAPAPPGAGGASTSAGRAPSSTSPTSSPPATSAPGSTTPGSTAPGSTAPGRAAATVPGPGPDIQHGSPGSSAVALTFHGAGDPAITRDVVRELAGAGAAITVMAVGTWLAEDPGTAKLLLDAGHELGNHTWSHRTMPRLSPADAVAEVQRGAQELRTLTGSPGRWFRPSGTQLSTPAIRAAATAAGYGACLSYDVDPLDYTDPGAGPVEQRLLAAVGPGSIVSLHLGHAGTRDALPAVLDGLRQRHLAAVTVSTLLGVA